MLESRVIRHRMPYRPICFAAMMLVAGTLIGDQAHGQGVDRAIDGPERAAVIDGVVEKILKIYVYPDVARQMERAIRDRQARKEYDTISSGQELARVLTRHLRDVCKDHHLSVDFFAKGIPYDAERKPDPKEVEEFRQRGLRRNYEFRKVERLEGGIGLLQVDGFYPADWIAETAAGAMAFLANSESVILDLRQNGGGQSGGTLLCSYFLEEETHLTDVYNRPENTTRQVWSYPVAGGAKFANKDLYILTSHRTFSAPEALAYDMQALKRRDDRRGNDRRRCPRDHGLSDHRPLQREHTILQRDQSGDQDGLGGDRGKAGRCRAGRPGSTHGPSSGPEKGTREVRRSTIRGRRVEEGDRRQGEGAGCTEDKVTREQNRLRADSI